jgi:superfamily II DNA or RNA helicase
MTNKYSFQNDLIAKVIASFKYLPYVILAGCVGAGKTTMANRIMQNYKKVLVLAHGQDVLRTQFAETAQKFSDSVHIIKKGNQFTNKIRKLKKGIVITLPQTIKNIEDLGDFDLIVADEAHQFYLAEMVQNICDRLPKAKRLLLSATPFTLRSLDLPEHSFTLDRALDIGIMSNASMEVMTSCYNYNLADYNQDASLKKEIDTKITKKETEQTMDAVLNALVTSVAETRLDKTIIVASGIHQANYIASYLKKSKIEALVSHSKEDVSSERITLFKKSKSISVLVVVGRAKLGFDMPELVNMVDMSGTLNPALLYQMLGRVTRVHPKGKKKRFIKLTPSNLHKYSYAVMCITAGLCQEDFFKHYDPENYTGMPIPREVYGADGEPDDAEETNLAQYKKSILDLAATCDIFNKLNYNPNNILDKSAYITLAEIRAKMLDIVWWDYDSAKKEATNYNSMFEWQSNSRGSYRWAERNKVHRRIANELGWGVKSFWNYETALTEAAKYTSLKEWHTKSKGSYSWALKNKVQRKIAEELGWKTPQATITWTYGTVYNEAANYTSIKEWQTKSHSSYQWALKNKVQRKIAEELGWKIRTTWTYETAKKEAAEYSSIKEWRTLSHTSYQWALKNKVQRKIAEELGWEVRRVIAS